MSIPPTGQCAVEPPLRQAEHAVGATDDLPDHTSNDPADRAGMPLPGRGAASRDADNALRL